MVEDEGGGVEDEHLGTKHWCGIWEERQIEPESQHQYVREADSEWRVVWLPDGIGHIVH